MNKKYIEELSREELEKVFRNNRKLREAIRDDMYDSEMFWIGEHLDYIRRYLRNWSIGAYSHNYIEINDYEGFVLGMQEMDKEMPALIDEDMPILERAVELMDVYTGAKYIEEEDLPEYADIEEEFTEAVNDLKDILIKRLERSLEGCYDEEYQLSYFLEFYMDARLERGCYIDADSEDYHLYADVVKSFV